jgi:hypothetical protein
MASLVVVYAFLTRFASKVLVDACETTSVISLFLNYVISSGCFVNNATKANFLTFGVGIDEKDVQTVLKDHLSD